MDVKSIVWYSSRLMVIIFLFLSSACNSPKSEKIAKGNLDSATEKSKQEVKYPSDIVSLEDWKILLGDGTSVNDLKDYAKDDFFYVAHDGDIDWVVFKTPNSGITSRTSSNTRTELGEKARWVPSKGSKLSGTCKVMHVSTTGDARVAASYSTVIGQIHGDDGHENEPLKIFYKKFPGHKKGSVYWNYEINTSGDNSKRWDYSTSVWGHDMSVIGSAPTTYPAEPTDGIALGETFSYEINVYEGIMYLTFISEGHPTRRFTKSLIKSQYTRDKDIPQQIRTLYAVIDRDGTENPSAYAGENQYFKLGAYNQTNGKKPETNMVWSTGSEIYGGDLEKQYANGSYTEVWYKDCRISEGSLPEN